MKIIFIGGLFPDERTNEIIENSKGIIQFAANTFQWLFIKGLDIFFDRITIYTAPLLGNYPKTYKKFRTKKSEFFHNSKSKDYCIGYLQLPFISLFSKTINIYRTLLQKETSKDPYILVYCVHTPYLLAAVRYKRKYPETKICLIVTDLPEYMSSKTGHLYSILKKIDLRLIDYLIRRVDSFVFCTDSMASHFELNSRPWIRIEGMYDYKNESETITESNYNSKIILYTGTLDSRYGILNLIEAFELIPNPEYQLWICGEGNMRKHVTGYQKRDSRVKYYGQLSRTDAISLQKQAAVLVNPRTSDGEYTKYSFPIKTMEYLASGKPCIMHLLPGIPHEYIEHLFIPENETPVSLSQKIVEVLNMDPNRLSEHCRKSKAFIINEKNPESQISRLSEMLNR